MHKWMSTAVFKTENCFKSVGLNRKCFPPNVTSYIRGTLGKGVTYYLHVKGKRRRTLLNIVRYSTAKLCPTLWNPHGLQHAKLPCPSPSRRVAQTQSWIFIGRTDAEAETPIIWPPDAKNWLIWKDLDAGKDWRQEKGMTEDEMVGWHHRLDGYESE